MNPLHIIGLRSALPLSMLLLFAQFMTGCSKPNTAGTSRAGTPDAAQTNQPAANELSNRSNESASAKFHLTGVLLNRDRTPATNKTVVMHEISGEGGNRKLELKFALIDNQMQLADPHARLVANGHFDIEVDPSVTQEKKEFGLIIIDLGLPATQRSNSPPFLSANGKRIVFRLEGPPKENSLGEIVVK